MSRRRRAPRGVRRLVDSGRVTCPIRGDLDTDYCFACNHLVDIVDDEGARYMVCRPPRAIPGLDVPAPIGF